MKQLCQWRAGKYSRAGETLERSVILTHGFRLAGSKANWAATANCSPADTRGTAYRDEILRNPQKTNGRVRRPQGRPPHAWV